MSTLDKDIEEIKVLLARIETDVRHHIRRTDLLEEEVRTWRKEMRPVQQHVATVGALGKILILVTALATAAAAVIALL